MNISAISNNSYDKQSFGAIFQTRINPKQVKQYGELMCEGAKAVTGKTINGYCTSRVASDGTAEMFLFTENDAQLLPNFMKKFGKEGVKGFVQSTGEEMDRTFLSSWPRTIVNTEYANYDIMAVYHREIKPTFDAVHPSFILNG